MKDLQEMVRNLKSGNQYCKLCMHVSKFKITSKQNRPKLVDGKKEIELFDENVQ